MDLMRVKRGGWPFLGPPNCDFELNTNSPQCEKLLAWWPSLGVCGSTAIDKSGHGYNAPFSGNMAIAGDGMLGQVFSFDGTNSYINVSAMPKPSLPFTLSLWAKAPAFATHYEVFDSAPNTADVFRIRDAYGSAYAEWHNESPNVNIGTYLTNNTWALLTLVVDFDTNRRIYVYTNGVYRTVGTGSASSTLAWTNTPRFGTVNAGTDGWFDGKLADIRFWNRRLSAAEIWSLYNPATRWELCRPMVRWWVGYAPAGGPDYTLTADAGSYTLTGTAADLLVSRLLDAAAGTYTLTGTDAALLASRLLDAAAGTFTMTGADAELLASRLLDAGAGSFTLTGTDAGLLASRLLDAAAGTYTLTGTDAALLASRLLDAEGGAFTLTGADAGLLVSRLLDAAAGAFTLTGIDVTLDYSGAGAPDYTLTAEAGSYTLTGADAGLIASRLLSAEVGTYTLTGADADLLRGFFLDAEPGAYALTGIDAELILSRVLNAQAGSYLLNGLPATLIYSGALVAETPPCRIYVIPAEDRVFVIAFEDRTLVIPAEDRTYRISC